MLYRITFSALFILHCIFPGYAQAQRAAVRYVNAGDIVNMAKTSGKPYLLITIYVPKCANAPELFSERAAYYNKRKDKIDLVMLSILASNDNADTVARFSKLYNFETPLYVMDTMYTKPEVRETPMKFIKDLNQHLGVENEFFQYILIDKNGKMVYREDGDINTKKLDKYIK